ncbi:hypothetical protein DEO72_LG5g1298 [Vigna unguiculata]|uniref:Uncharacterized protein n=1 Tax=Vigna unguiculata TaxID=3917 RepID=A0A4D6LZ38_VIGUN|nr:hypothetical protein DEO72_LG5g1298 [Vigna unguiculata]
MAPLVRCRWRKGGRWLVAAMAEGRWWLENKLPWWLTEMAAAAAVEGGRETRVGIATWHDLVEWSLCGRRGAT